MCSLERALEDAHVSVEGSERQVCVSCAVTEDHSAFRAYLYTSTRFPPFVATCRARRLASISRWYGTNTVLCCAAARVGFGLCNSENAGRNAGVRSEQVSMFSMFCVLRLSWHQLSITSGFFSKNRQIETVCAYIFEQRATTTVQTEGTLTVTGCPPIDVWLGLSVTHCCSFHCCSFAHVRTTEKTARRTQSLAHLLRMSSSSSCVFFSNSRGSMFGGYVLRDKTGQRDKYIYKYMYPTSENEKLPPQISPAGTTIKMSMFACLENAKGSA